MKWTKKLKKEVLQIKSENLQLRDAAKRRTIELENKNKELEIESSLEKVRAVAICMRTPNDLLSICEVLYSELQTLGFSEIRNSMINIHDDENRSFVNYDYSVEIGKSFNQLNYNIHPLIKKQIKQIGNSSNAFSETSFTGKDLEQWKAFRKSIGERDDPRIDETSALYYYFYSIGIGSVGISTFSPIKEEKLDILKRFSNVFDFAYRRYMDVVQAETQAREAQIELALERVRARTMAMQRSEELQEASSLLFQQVKNLDIETGSCGFNIWEKEGTTATVWMSSQEGGLQAPFNLPHTESKHLKHIFTASQDGEEFLVAEVAGEELKKHFNYLLTLPIIGDVVKSYVEADIPLPVKIIYNIAFFKHGYLSFHTHKSYPAAGDIFKRFAKVFEQTYIRFLDLQKAEAQAREAQIETALEKIRSRSLTMHRSDELQDVVNTVFDRLRELKIDMNSASIFIFRKGSKDWEQWVATSTTSYSTYFHIPFLNHPIFQDLEDAKQNGTDFYAVRYSFEEKNNWFDDAFTNTEYSRIPDDRKEFMLESECLIISFAVARHTALQVAKYSGDFFSRDENEIIKRISKVFEQAYVRFLDLQKAEAQAREAQIEAALEKVRSRTMGMQNSQELADVSLLINEQLQILNSHNFSAGFVIDYQQSNDFNFWISRVNQKTPDKLHIPYFDHPIFNRFVEAKEKGLDFYTVHLTFEEKNSWLDHAIRHLPEFEQEMKTYLYQSPGYTNASVLMKHVMLFIENYSDVPFSDSDNDILKRFGLVFEQTYTRFLDLQKAEKQAREAQVEAALERVRARTMAMHKSEELADTAAHLFKQLNELGIYPYRCNIGIIDAETEKCQLWSTTNQGAVIPLGTFIPMTETPLFIAIYTAWKSKLSHSMVKLEGKDRLEMIQYFTKFIPYAEFKPSELTLEKVSLQTSIFNNFYFKQGFIAIHTNSEINEPDLQVIHRFTKVFEQTYTRFLDLQKAEAQAREAQIELALERVRSKAMAMQNSNELSALIGTVFNELTNLDLKLTRCGIWIFNPENLSANTWMANSEDPSKPAKYFIKFHEHEPYLAMVNGWKGKKETLVYNLQGEIKKSWDDYLFTETDFSKLPKVVIKGMKTPKQVILSFSFNNFGAIHSAGLEPLSDDHFEILLRFAKVFDLTYTRFNDLKQAEQLARQAQIDLENLIAAKKKTDDALHELKATQAQLIQSEKMASLGELTAGIAHEIQNPLNFVNNFSEVSTELVDEMKDEIDKGNLEDALEIANDLIQNLEKINHHGKRADEIVKGMLQHSQSSSGEMELTDINALAEEYLRLAYHGFRAKHESLPGRQAGFNTEYELELDPNLPKVHVVPQDIGRVFLNLINNAFYAVKNVDNPKVLASTRRVASPLGVGGENEQYQDRIEIIISDNGPGIPEYIMDKIFQPFFTTKPTGQGTGLGLSLSYDIVKAHGGELKVETKEGEGSEFIVSLPVV